MRNFLCASPETKIFPDFIVLTDSSALEEELNQSERQKKFGRKSETAIGGRKTPTYFPVDWECHAFPTFLSDGTAPALLNREGQRASRGTRGVVHTVRSHDRDARWTSGVTLDVSGRRHSACPRSVLERSVLDISGRRHAPVGTVLFLTEKLGFVWPNKRFAAMFFYLSSEESRIIYTEMTQVLCEHASNSHRYSDTYIRRVGDTRILQSTCTVKISSYCCIRPN